MEHRFGLNSESSGKVSVFFTKRKAKISENVWTSDIIQERGELRSPSPLRDSIGRGGGPAHAVACRRQRRAIGLARPRVAEILLGCGGSFPPLSLGLSVALGT